MDRDVTINIHIDGFGRTVAKMVGLMLQPYADFIKELHAAGRISDAELEAVRQALEERVKQLPNLIGRGDESQSPDDRPPTAPDRPRRT